MLLARTRRTIVERRLIRRGDRVLVAVSGGPDSTAMLDVLARLAPELGFALEVASIDHGLREGAARELDLARTQATGLALPFHAERLALEAGPAIPERARIARYRALRAIAARISAQRIAVGHTLDDQAETVLSRMLRGSGARGLAGIAPRRADGVIRPLIDAPRAEVRSWCAAHGLASADDPSNVDPRFERARIRHEILPVLAAESPAIARHLAAIADDARALGVLARRGARRLRRYAEAEELDANRFAAAPEAVRREALGAWASALGGRPLGRAHLDALEAALQGKGEARLPGGWTARLEGSRLRAFTVQRSHQDGAGEARNEAKIGMKKHEPRGPHGAND